MVQTEYYSEHNALCERRSQGSNPDHTSEHNHCTTKTYHTEHPPQLANVCH